VVNPANFVAYVKAPSTSIAGTATVDTHVTNPTEKLANEPQTGCGYRTTPPEIGDMGPSSA
jgi:hypothetical protein